MHRSVCRWGILGAAEIARKNWQAIRNASNCTLTAVASRDPEKCRRFVAECQSHVPFPVPPQVCGSYEELLSSDAVDAVYLPLPTVVRKSWAIRAAEAGKHVLSEKPAGATAADVREILAACRRNGVQFMDGVMFLHSRRLERIRQLLDDGTSVGQVRRIASHFAFPGSEDFFQHDIRTHSGLEPLGCLGDLGWYNIGLTLWVMRGQLPVRVCGHRLAEHHRSDSPAAVPIEFSAELFYEDGASASLYCSFRTENEQWAHISGTRGWLYIPDFVLPHLGSEVAFELGKPVLALRGCDFNMEQHTQRIAVSEYSNSHETSQEANLFRRFADLVLAGRPDPHWGQIALGTQQVLDACLQSARSAGRMIDLPA